MKLTKKTYKYISALSLILFLSSIVLPAGLSAASVFCDMNMAAMNSNVHSYCNFHETDQHDRIAKDLDEESCAFQEICKPILSREQIEIQAIPQFSKEFVAVFDYKETSVGLIPFNPSNSFRSESVVPYNKPPLFLLNSVFLN